ncbi:MAG: flagellar biosynthetic protein FliR [Pirellulales bacterium]
MASDALTAFLSTPLWVFMTVLARIGPVLILTPPTRSSGVPNRVRAGLAIAMAVMVTPTAMPAARPMPADMINLILGLAGEVLLGMIIGCVVLLSVSAIQLSGQAIGHLAGFDVADALDPNMDETMSILATLLGWLAIALLLIMGGHRQLFECCLDSYQAFPAGGVVPQNSWLQDCDELIRNMLRIGIRAAAPIGTALLLANLLTGLIARTLPQLSVLAVGFNINAMLLLMLLMVSLGSVAWVFQSELASWFQQCRHIISERDW